jgi:hypothetical protein
MKYNESNEHILSTYEYLQYWKILCMVLVTSYHFHIFGSLKKAFKSYWFLLDDEKSC